jgi:hypothetical protein
MVKDLVLGTPEVLKAKTGTLSGQRNNRMQECAENNKAGLRGQKRYG